jgi:prolyl oligopeptidase
MTARWLSPTGIARHILPVIAIAMPARLAAQGAAPLQYPAARTVDQVDNYHGLRVADPYRWLEDIDSPEVKAWAAAENRVTQDYLARLPNREAIKARLTTLWNYPRVTIPYWEGGHWFYRRNTGLQRQSVWYVRDALDGQEHVLLDPNQLSPDGSIALSLFSPAPDGKHYAYGLSEGGSDWETLLVRDFASGENTGDTVRWVKFSGASWTKDGKGFFYSRFPVPPKGKEIQTALVNGTLYYHRLGTAQAADAKIYARPDQPTWIVGGGLDESRRYLFVVTSKGTDKNELYIADLGDPLKPNLQAAIKPVVTGHDANYRALGVVNGRLYLQVDKDAPNRKIVSAPVETPGPKYWHDVIPEGKTAIQSADLVAGRLGVLTLEDVAATIRLYSLDGRDARAIPLPGLGTASGVAGRFDRPEVFYDYQSMLTPYEVLQFDPASGSSRPFEPPHLTFDPTQFEMERVFYNSKDGTRVPMFIAHRKGMVRDGSNPTMLYAYGGFDVPIGPDFSPALIDWLEMGGVYAQPSIRGGSEYGEAWHHAAMFEKKQNVFDDFIAAGEYLIREKITSAEKLAINGGSNGGLLVGAVMTQRPDLFAVALPQVGVMDMMRYHKFSGGGLWATEYGNSDDSTAARYLRAYSPLQNIKSGVCYPATLVTTSDHDDRVVPSHSFKFAATLQAAQSAAPTCTRPTLLRVELEGSHGYRPTDRQIAERADMWAFAAAGLGMGAPPVP